MLKLSYAIILCGLFFATSLIAETETVTDANGRTITWTYRNKHSYATLTGSTLKTDLDGEVILPSKLDGMPVQTIANGAFQGCKKLTAVTLPDTIVLIGWETFASCYSLARVTLPKNLKVIFWSTFQNCSSLTSLFIPASVTRIHDFAFIYSTHIYFEVADANPAYSSQDGLLFNKAKTLLIQGRDCDGLKLPDGLKEIGKTAFIDCSTALKTITLPASMEQIHDAAFHNCSSLQSLTLPEGLTRISEGAFRGCKACRNRTKVLKRVIGKS